MVLVTNPRAVDFRDESQKFPVSVSTLSTRVATTTAFVCYAKGQPVDSLDIFEVLVRENSRMLTAFIQSAVRNPAAVDDIWQETMVTAWKRWDDFDRSRPFGAWLRGIARNNIRSWQRATAKNHTSVDNSTLEYFDAVFAQIQSREGDTFTEKLEVLRLCIQALPAHYKDVVNLRYEEGLMPATIAEQQTRPLETIKKRLQRAKTMLFDCMTRKSGIGTSTDSQRGMPCPEMN